MASNHKRKNIFDIIVDADTASMKTTIVGTAGAAVGSADAKRHCAEEGRVDEKGEGMDQGNQKGGHEGMVQGKKGHWNVVQVVGDAVERPIETTVAMVSIVRPQQASATMKYLGKVFPLGGLQHLKRIKTTETGISSSSISGSSNSNNNILGTSHNTQGAQSKRNSDTDHITNTATLTKTKTGTKEIKKPKKDKMENEKGKGSDNQKQLWILVCSEEEYTQLGSDRYTK